MNALSRAALALAIAAPCMAQADTTSDLQSLRDEIAHIRADYDSRIQSLETRLKAAEAAQTPTSASAIAAPNSAAAAAAGGGGGGGFNPAVSLILSGTYTRTSQDPATYRLRGFPLPPDAEVGPGTRGFSLGESELGLSASVDPWFSGTANIAFKPDNSVSIEEAFFRTTALGNGLTVKAGRFFSSIGYLNSQHAHTWDFVDAPLAYQAMLGGQFNDDAMDVAWLLPTDQFIELRAELGRGRSYPGTDTNRNGAGMAALIAHIGGDIGDSNSWRAGVSLLHTNATAQALSDVNAVGAGVTNAFDGSTRTWVADFVWKWAPNGNATRTNFKLQGEYLQSTRIGSLTYDVTGTNSTDAYRARQSGWYLQGVYQFMPRWRAGLRTESISGGTASYGSNGPFLVASQGKGRRNSVMVDYTLTEFSRLRLQYAHNAARFGAADNQIWLQYQMSLGAHGAHSF